MQKLEAEWDVRHSISDIEKDNSGIKEIENLNLFELERRIDGIISEAAKFFVSNPDKQEIIRRFQKITFLGYSSDVIYSNDTVLSDEELKKFLRQYDSEFKKPIKWLLREYFRVKYNPDLVFQGLLLEKLNFRQCAICAKVDEQNHSVINRTLENKAIEDGKTNNDIDLENDLSKKIALAAALATAIF